MNLTLDALKRKERAKVKPAEFARLRGCSVATLSRERWRGSPVPFERDDRTGRVTYDAQDVLDYLERPKFSSTSAYEHGGCERMAIARNAKTEAP